MSLATKGSTTPTKRDGHSVSKRLQNELMKLMMAGCKGVSAFPDGDNLFKWIGTIEGPENTIKKPQKDYPTGYDADEVDFFLKLGEQDWI